MAKSQDQSNKADAQKQQEQRIQYTLSKIKNRVVIFSGKGGVGKTSVSVNLAYALVQHQYRVGLLDADITGPNVPKMMGLQGFPLTDPENQTISPQERAGLQVISIAPMIPEDAPVIWRGPLRSSAITQFLADVVWGELDFLLADLPPGTGDEVLTTAQKMQPQAAIVVTTPQEISLIDCRRAVNMAKKLEIPFIGVVENMSGLICPHCGKTIDVFGRGGGKSMARHMDAIFLGSIPMDLAVRSGGDEGIPIVLSDPENPASAAFIEAARRLVSTLSS
ncbi:MAG TPA: ATP-binding protein [bacterium]|nr:ATP-binding protein [bacterium]